MLVCATPHIIICGLLLLFMLHSAICFHCMNKYCISFGIVLHFELMKFNVIDFVIVSI